jgi:RHS repeat-associated protein
VLSDGTTDYLYGNSRIAQVNTTTEYFLGDAIGSVRQMTDQAGALTFAQSYDPYGVVTFTDGTSETEFGFTGEQYAATTQLLYLRARYYNPMDGRFMSRDTWSGDVNNPLSLNRWNYSHSNPVNYTDSSGHSIGCLGSVFSYGTIPVGMKASQLISMCREFYTPNYWAQHGIFNCNNLNALWSKPQTVGALFQDYICERGPDLVSFDRKDNLTKQLIYSVLLDKVRREFYRGGTSYPKEYPFNIAEALMAFGDTYAANIIHTPDFPLTHFLGSFNATVTAMNSGRIKIIIDNRSDLASGTHFPLRYPPEGEGTTPLSLEKVIRENPSLANNEAWYVIINYRDSAGRPIVSILPPLSRSQTPNGMGGGIMRQVFTWTENDLSCEIQKLPWPIYLPLLNIQ